MAVNILGWEDTFWSLEGAVCGKSTQPCALFCLCLWRQDCLSSVIRLLLAPLRSYYASTNWVTASKALCLVNQALWISYHICLVILYHLC
jgi:hypothetical protein